MKIQECPNSYVAIWGKYSGVDKFGLSVNKDPEFIWQRYRTNGHHFKNHVDRGTEGWKKGRSEFPTTLIEIL